MPLITFLHPVFIHRKIKLYSRLLKILPECQQRVSFRLQLPFLVRIFTISYRGRFLRGGVGGGDVRGCPAELSEV